MRKPFNCLFIVLAILFQAISGIFGKYAALAITISSPFPFNLLTNPFYLLSLICMVLQALVWQQALKHYPLSFAYPFMSLVNFIVLIPSAVLFGEGITVGNLVGLSLISVGITLLTGEAKNGYVSKSNQTRRDLQ